MREKSFALAFIVVLLGMMGTISPGSATPPEDDLLPLYDGFSDTRVGNIAIDPAKGHYATKANMGKQNGKLYYELMAYNPSGVPMTITWGMVKSDMNGHLHFNDTFDSFTLAWVKNYGLCGATYSVRLL
jgi:hypothetical protein